MRRLLLALVVAALAGCSGSSGEEQREADGVPGAAGDVRALVTHLEQAHPDPYHAVRREAFAATAAAATRCSWS